MVKLRLKRCGRKQLLHLFEYKKEYRMELEENRKFLLLLLSQEEGRDLRKVGFYDPITNQTYLNLPAILDFLKKGAQPTRTVHDISKKAGIFTELNLNKTKLN
ncbi:hypothetical protein N665_0221s0055 [Sinapis alba]|nr:hypothetical protein N665_0221s0055 [Sinapis alba]